MKNILGIVLFGAFIMSCCGGRCKSGSNMAAAAPKFQQSQEQAASQEEVCEKKEEVCEKKEEPKYQDGDLIMIQFSADWCGPCRQLKGMLKSSQKFKDYIKKETKGYFIVDVDSKDKNQAAWTNMAKPSSIPLVVSYRYKEGKWSEASRFSGVRSVEGIISWLGQTKGQK